MIVVIFVAAPCGHAAISMLLFVVKVISSYCQHLYEQNGWTSEVCWVGGYVLRRSGNESVNVTFFCGLNIYNVFIFPGALLSLVFNINLYFAGTRLRF